MLRSSKVFTDRIPEKDLYTSWHISALNLRSEHSNKTVPWLHAGQQTRFSRGRHQVPSPARLHQPLKPTQHSDSPDVYGVVLSSVA